MDIKVSKAQLSKIIQSGGFLCKTLGNVIGSLGKKALNTPYCFPLDKDVLHKLATKAASFAKEKFERKISETGVVRAGKRFTSFTSNQDFNNFIKIAETLENSGLLIDGAIKPVKPEITGNKEHRSP